MVSAVALLLAASAWSAEVIDRTVAVVGQDPITSSDLDRQMRLEAMFNDRNVDASPAARQATLERLIEQRLIESDMQLAGYVGADVEELAAAYAGLRAGRFNGLAFTDALTHYDVSEDAALDFYRRQVDFAGYVRFRFRTGLDVTDQEVAAAYRQRHPELPRGQSVPPAAAEELRAQLLDTKTANLLDVRVKQLRAQTRIVRLEPIVEPEDEPPAPEVQP